MSDIDEFLQALGMKDKPNLEPNAEIWDKIIVPQSCHLIVGDVGTGKSALCYWLMERYSAKYNLEPCVVGLPPNKLNLLPNNYQLITTPDEVTKKEHSIIFIDEADLQLKIEDIKAREYVTNFLSQYRQRKAILLLSFHYPRLVLARYLPFFSAFLHKRPPYLIEFASKSKNDTLAQMMYKAEERFGELVLPNWDGQGQPKAVLNSTYVVAPRIRWQGMLTNPLCTFWSQDLSEIWAGTDVTQTNANQADMFGKTKRSYAHLPESEIMGLCLACARLDDAAYDKIWKPKYQSFMDKMTEKADKYNLWFANLDMRGWIIRRVHDGSKCVMVTKQSCPCSNPLAAGCPVLRGNQT